MAGRKVAGLIFTLGLPLARCAFRLRGGSLDLARPMSSAVRVCAAADAVSTGAVVEVYSTVGCPYCVRAKKKLAELGVPYVEYDVTSDEATRQRVAQLTSRTSVPQIFVGGVHLGGCDDLMAAVKDGKLDGLLDASGISRIATAGSADDAAAQETGSWDPAELLPVGGILNHGRGRAAAGAGTTSSANWLTDRTPQPLTPESSAQLASELQKTVLALYDDFVTADGSRVDYNSMLRSGRLHAYAAQASRLESLSLSQLPADVPSRCAFWLNLYNALVIHANAVVGPPTDKAGRGAFYSGASGVAYRVAGHTLSLDDIEHGIIRGSPPDDPRAFPPGDPRAPLVIPRSSFDPRIHFALNCGARSCPPIKIYEAANLERGLALAAQSFCEGTVRVDELRATVTLSKLFEWYRVDFGRSDEEVLRRVVRFLGGSAVGGALERLLDARPSGGVAIEYSEYDWGANAAESS